MAENKEVPDSNIGVPPVRKYANYRILRKAQIEPPLIECGELLLQALVSYLTM